MLIHRDDENTLNINERVYRCKTSNLSGQLMLCNEIQLFTWDAFVKLQRYEFP